MRNQTVEDVAAVRRIADVEGLAEELAVNVSFVRRLVWERRIPYFKIGKLVWFDLGEVDDWLDSHHVDALR